jgi:hypothetical protein
MSRVQNGNSIGSDLKLAEYILGADLQVNGSGDIDVTSEEMNLAQAILHRIRTVKGELADLGHAEYGSTVLDFVGQANDWTTRERLRLAIRDTIRQERRVKEIVSINVKPRTELVATSSSDNNAKNIGTAYKRESIGQATRGFSEGETSKGEERNMAGGGSDNDDGIQAYSNQQLYPDSSDIMNSVDIDIVIIPQDQQRPLQIAFPFKLEAS